MGGKKKHIMINDSIIFFHQIEKVNFHHIQKYLLQVGRNYTSKFRALSGGICNEDCPTSCLDWQYFDAGWKMDTSVRVECLI